MSTATLTPAPATLFPELKRQVLAEGLLDRQPLFYGVRLTLNLALMAACVVLTTRAESAASVLLCAVFLGCCFVQTAEVAHDAAHYQIATSARANQLLGLIHLNLLLGASLAWWTDKHDTHHRHPNELGRDPDITFSVVAFHEEQLRTKTGFARFAVAHQAVLYPFWVMLMPFGMRVASVKKLLRGESRRPRAEAALIAVNAAAYLALLWQLPGPWLALGFVLVHHAVTGLYMAGIFAPNHKGMPILPEGTTLDFVTRQVVTARNVRGGPVTDFLLGGLNYQIEHHLFPSMPRNQLKRARVIVRAACERAGLPYHETSALGSYVEAFRDLALQSAPLRRAGARAGATPHDDAARADEGAADR